MRLLLVVFVCSCVMSAKAQTSLPLMPMPTSVQMGNGQLIIDSSFSVALTGPPDVRLQNAAQRFADHLRQRTGMPLLSVKVKDGMPGTLVVNIDHASKGIQELGEDESYSLEVTASGATLNAPNNLGAMHGLQTFYSWSRLLRQDLRFL